MAPTIFLHIGLNKTGTTAIQKFFTQNREDLQRHRLLYPVTGASRRAHYQVSAALGFLPAAKRKTTDVVSPPELRRALEEEISSSSAEAVLLSSEMFTRQMPLQPVRELFSGYPVKIVVYLRRHDHWWESVYNQAVKTVTNPPWGSGIDEFLAFRRSGKGGFRYFGDLVDHWATTFGKENIIVRPYEREQNQPNIVVDILRAIGYGHVATDIPVEPEHINQSLSSAALERIDQYQRSDLDDDTRAQLIAKTKKRDSKTDPQSEIDPELRLQLVQENLQDYAYIAKEYLGREDGRLFWEPLPELDGPGSWRDKLVSESRLVSAVKAIKGSMKGYSRS